MTTHNQITAQLDAMLAPMNALLGFLARTRVVHARGAFLTGDERGRVHGWRSSISHRGGRLFLVVQATRDGRDFGATQPTSSHDTMHEAEQERGRKVEGMRKRYAAQEKRTVVHSETVVAKAPSKPAKRSARRVTNYAAPHLHHGSLVSK